MLDTVDIVLLKIYICYTTRVFGASDHRRVTKTKHVQLKKCSRIFVVSKLCVDFC